MTKKSLVVGALLVALGGGAFALAAGGHSKEKGKHAGACPMRVSGAAVKVVNIDSGVVIHVTSDDAATVAMIQGAAAGRAGHSGCKHCPGHGAAAPAKAGRGDAAVYACSMGDYSGPRTKDGRCPKCGMALTLKQ
ncbi:MAG: hypothetical protein NUW21_09835 [Elusimicrobia bacterium]|nr:hypothetical protein [Elusimicrobiota bacterium]